MIRERTERYSGAQDTHCGKCAEAERKGERQLERDARPAGSLRAFGRGICDTIRAAAQTWGSSARHNAQQKLSVSGERMQEKNIPQCRHVLQNKTAAHAAARQSRNRQ